MLQAKDSLDLRLLNPMTLAFVGDGVYEMLAREEVVRRHISLSADDCTAAPSSWCGPRRRPPVFWRLSRC